MPSFVPRSDTTRKEELLTKRVQELQNAIRSNFTSVKLSNAVERYRTAQLTLLKAKFHVLKEMQYKGKPATFKPEKLESEIQSLTIKSEQAIIDEFKIAQNKV